MTRDLMTFLFQEFLLLVAQLLNREDDVISLYIYHSDGKRTFINSLKLISNYIMTKFHYLPFDENCSFSLALRCAVG